jgi:hypothetical protein
VSGKVLGTLTFEGKCPHHDKPVVCGECGGEGRMVSFWSGPEFPAHVSIYERHPFRPAHRVDGVLVECTA